MEYEMDSNETELMLTLGQNFLFSQSSVAMIWFQDIPQYLHDGHLTFVHHQWKQNRWETSLESDSVRAETFFISFLFYLSGSKFKNNIFLIPMIFPVD